MFLLFIVFMQDSSQTSRPDTPAISLPAQAHAVSVKTARRKAVDTLTSASGNRPVLQTDSSAKTTMLLKDTTAMPASVEKSKQVNFFSSHELKVTHQGPQSLNRTTPDWIFPVLLLVIAAFAWLRTFYYKYFIQIMSAFLNTNLTNQIVRDENILVQRASVMLNIVFNLVAALFLYFASIHFSWSMGGMHAGFNRYLFFVLIVSAAYALKFLVLKICGYLFQVSREMAAYLFNIFLINNVLGMLLIPMVALLAFSNTISTTWIMTLSLFFAAAAFIYRIVRGLALGFASPAFSPYYIFMYLCTLEFAPLIVLIKILRQQ